MKKSIKISILVLLALPYTTASASEWKFGFKVAYVSGISDVVDQYEENLIAEGFFAVDVTEIPIGIGFKSQYLGDSGFTAGVDIGPLFFIGGDADHFEAPIFGTVGYSFFHNSSVSPYIQVGAAYHIANGDYVESSTPGFYGSAGIAFGDEHSINWGFEAAIDKSEVELEVVSNGSTVDINTYDALFSIFMLF